MPPSDADAPPAGQGLAVAAEALYLINLMLVPGLAFLILVGLWWREKDRAPALARCHLAQTVSASLWAGGLLVAANIAIILLGGYDAASTWVVVILWFTCVHSTLILFGVVGLARALSGKPYVYPLVGRPCRG